MSTEKKPKSGVAAKVRQLAEPLAQELGLHLWDVQYAKEGAEWVLKIIIDKDSGVGIDDCVNMTHAVTPVLDTEDPVPQEYVLEVSSPGLDRKLTRLEHFAAYLGELVRARLMEYDGTQLEIQLDEETSVTLEKKELAWVSAIDEVEL